MKQESPENPPPDRRDLADLDYQLLRLIGQGSYGEVWLARDQAGSYLACKVVHRARFDHDRPYEREYAGIQKFEPISRASENQLKILHVGRRDDQGYFYYIMELADDASGLPIDPNTYTAKTIKTELQQKGRLPVDECIRIGKALATGLQNLHEHGLIHRDIKPANVIFVDGTPRLADIGLITDSSLTISYVGTEGYIPPEGPKSPQADIYSLGKVLYEMCTGRDRLDFPELPEGFENLPETERETLLELNAIVSRACETNPGERYQSAEEMSADLALLERGDSVRQRRSARQRQKTGIRILLVLLCLGLGVGVAAVIFSRKSHPVPRTFTPTAPPDALSPAIINPNNGHFYFLLRQANWTDSEAQAVAAGGHLATIRNQQEQDWVFETFSRYGGTNRLLWIGLNDAALEGRFVWSSGEPVTYTNWAKGSPDNTRGNENYVSMYESRNQESGKWNDWSNRVKSPFRKPLHGVVEIIPATKNN